MLLKRAFALVLFAVALGSSLGEPASAQVRGLTVTGRAAVSAEQAVIKAEARRQTAIRKYAQNLQRGRTEASIRENVLRAEAVAAREQAKAASNSLSQRFARVNNPGVVYLRHNPVIGQQLCRPLQGHARVPAPAAGS